MQSQNNTETNYYTDTTEREGIIDDQKVEVPDFHVRSLSIPKLPDGPLLDKVTISNIVVDHIDNIDSLVYKGIIEQHYKARNYIETASGLRYSRLQIKNTGLFDNFVQLIGERGLVLTYLELSIHDPIYHNLVGYSLAQYKQRLNEIKSFLWNYFGISINIQQASFKYLEIQKTIVLDQECSEYERAATLLMDNIPKARKLKPLDIKYGDDTDSEKKYGQTLSRTSGKRGLEIVLYDKGAQLDKKNYPREKPSPSNLYRLELKLRSKECIKRKLGTCVIWELNDSDINTFFRDFVTKNFYETYEKNAAGRIDELVKKIRQFRPKYYHWIREILLMIADHELDHHVPLMLDVKEFLQAMDIVGYSDPKQRYYIHQSAMNICHKYIHTFERGDDLKYQKLLAWFYGSNVKI